MQHLTSRRYARLAVAGLVVACVLLVAVPATAFAGHVLNRTTGPSTPDPFFDDYACLSISGPNVAYAIQNVTDDVDSGLWTIGAPALSSWGAIFQAADKIDYSGTLVVWEVAGDIYVSDGSGAYNVRVGFAECANPTIDGYRVVWQDYRNGNWDIYGADLDPVTLAVTSEFPICTARNTQSKPDIASGFVVWQDKRRGQFDIYAKDMAGDSVWRVCGNARSQDSPRTDGRWVVWTDWRNRGYSADIYGKALPTGRERRICHAAEKQWQPVVSDGFVVWTDHRSGRRPTGSDPPPQYSLRGYEISSRDAFVISDRYGAEANPDMDGHTVVYRFADDTHHGAPVWFSIRAATLQH